MTTESKRTRKFPCLCYELEGKTTCDYASWPVGIKVIEGAAHLFIFQKDEDGLHEIFTVRNEWLPKLVEALQKTGHIVNIGRAWFHLVQWSNRRHIK